MLPIIFIVITVAILGYLVISGAFDHILGPGSGDMPPPRLSNTRKDDHLHPAIKNKRESEKKEEERKVKKAAKDKKWQIEDDRRKALWDGLAKQRLQWEDEAKQRTQAELELRQKEEERQRQDNS